MEIETMSSNQAHKSCGSCMLCCKLLKIDILEKPSGTMCRHAVPGKGCSIYEERPDVCRAYMCDWLVNQRLGPEWNPRACHFIIHQELNGDLMIIPDTGHRDAWRAEPFYGLLKQTAVQLLQKKRMLKVRYGRDVVVMLPDRDEQVHVPFGHMITIRRQQTPAGARFGVVVEAPVVLT